MSSYFVLENGAIYTIRELEIGDAKLLPNYLKFIAAESDNLTFGPGEFCPTPEEEEVYIRAHQRSEDCLDLVAFYDGRIIGNLSFQAGGRKRIAHRGDFSVSVVKEYWGQGIASNLIRQMLEWAITSSITKINLKVKSDNTKAIDLYKRFGFEIEGKVTRDFLIKGIYYDSLLMGKIIENIEDLS